ncbi:MAG: hypothetical protein H6945_16880 [Zoogloeaceae bacterium]|nr:hypothetical protein [Rhodocyclaceae bacterium]MCP5237415.1 hypothetical protein [Zoogloeaceae bacterium]
MSTKFRIAFDGNLQEGVDRAQVIAQLVARFRMPEDKASRLFCGERVILKKGLDAEQAENYVRQLAAIGMKLEALGESPAGNDAVAPAARPVDGDGDGYRIVFAGGVLDGHSRQQVMAAARERLKLDQRSVAQVFSGREIGLKRGLDAAGAGRYLHLLRGLGMDVRSDPALAVEPDPVTTAAQPTAALRAEPSEAERQMMETAFWTDPAAQHNDRDEVERRLLQAMTADFDLMPPPASGGRDDVDDDDGEDALKQMAETMLNADAMMMYEHEIADAESRMRAQVAAIEPPMVATVAAADADVPMDSDAAVPASDDASRSAPDDAVVSPLPEESRRALDQTVVVPASEAQAFAAAVRAAEPDPATAEVPPAAAAEKRPVAAAPLPESLADDGERAADDAAGGLKLALLFAALALAAIAAWLVIGR